jgi:hypothetical protein
MKTFRLISYLTIALGLLIAPAAYTADKALDSSKASQPSPDQEKKRQERQKKISEKSLELNGSRWEVGLAPASGKDTTDILTFQDNQIRSENLEKKGFASTNYTISVQEGSDTAVWETMKTGKDGVVFMRGEWIKDSMNGVIIEQLKDGKETNEHSFKSAKRSAVAPNSPEDKTAKSAEPTKTQTAEPAKTLVSKEAKKSQKK